MSVVTKLKTRSVQSGSSCIYEDLRDLVKLDHNGNIGIGSMYFFKMKTELTDDEITRLKKHYSNRRNFQRLENWEPSPPGKPRKGRTTT